MRGVNSPQSFGRTACSRYVVRSSCSLSAAPWGCRASRSGPGCHLTTIRRLVGTLLDLGYVREESPKQYVLGPRMIHLGGRSARSLATWAMPHLTRLVDDLG